MKIFVKKYSKSIFWIYILILLLNLLLEVKSDLPVHCRKEKIAGEWTFKVNAETFQPSLKNEVTTCGHGFPNRIEKTIGEPKFSFAKYQKDVVVKLGADYKVYENGLIVGRYTPVYDEGFICWYKDSIFTVHMMYYYKQKGDKKPYSECDKTLIGWYVPNNKKNNKNWSCFYGVKNTSKSQTTSKGIFLIKSDHLLNRNGPINEKELQEMEVDSLSNHLKGGEVNIDLNQDQEEENKSIESTESEGNLFKSLQNEIANTPSEFMELKEKTILAGKSELMSKMSLEEKRNTKYEDQKEIVEEINSMDLLWKAGIHDDFKGLNLIELNEKVGLKRHYQKNINPSILNTT